MYLDRRRFLAACSLFGGVALAGVPKPDWRRVTARKRAVETLGTARNLVFILLEGGPSHVDTFDYKADRDTPDFIGPKNMGGWIWPEGIMPKLALRGDQFALLRGMSAVEAVHERGVYHLLTAHRPNNALINEIPDIASAMSYMLAGQRRDDDSLPTVLKVGNLGPGPGLFGEEHRGLVLDYSGSIANIQNYNYGYERRMELLDGLLSDMGAKKDARADRVRDIQSARDLMTDTELHALLGIGEDDDYDGEYDPSREFVRQCETTVRVLSANKGARVIQMQLGGWDHHDQIYSDFALPALARAFDDGLDYLMETLAGAPGVNGGTLLDETLIVAGGEFGRTVNGLNTSAGRDHYPYVNPIFMAGGGVQGGRVIGASNSDGSYVSDRGWSHNRYMDMSDLAATIYSAMGVDWTTQFLDTPSGRLFELVDSAVTGPSYHVDDLFV